PAAGVQMVQGMNNLTDSKDTSEDEFVVMMEASSGSWQLTLRNRLLRLTLDHNIAGYMTTYINVSSFINQYSGRVPDQLILGLSPSGEVTGPPELSNGLSKYYGVATEISHTIRLYSRYITCSIGSQRSKTGTNSE
ncbi:Pre-mRNA-processing-splicing factor 8, partial [Modicella reniformis]